MISATRFPMPLNWFPGSLYFSVLLRDCFLVGDRSVPRASRMLAYQPLMLEAKSVQIAIQLYFHVDFEACFHSMEINSVEFYRQNVREVGYAVIPSNVCSLFTNRKTKLPRKSSNGSVVIATRPTCFPYLHNPLPWRCNLILTFKRVYG